MQNKVRTEKIAFGIVWVFLLCYFMMLFDFPNVLTILLGSLICLILLVKQRKFRLDIGTCLLTVTIVSYFIILYGSRAFSMSLPYVGIIMYVLANYLSCDVYKNENSDLRYMQLLYVIVLGHAIHGILNSYMFLTGNLFQGSVRVWTDFWMQVFLPGTQQIVYFLPVLAFVFPAIIYFRRRKCVNILTILVAVFFIYMSMASQTRTSVLAFGLVFCGQAILYLILEREKILKILSNKKVQRAGIIVIVLAIFAVLILMKHPVVTSFISIMGRDGGVLNNIRFKIQRHALGQLFLYPMGGDQMDFLGYPHAHNAWLDMANMAGIIPFFAFAGYTIFTVYELIRWLMRKEISTERKLMVVGIYGVFFLYYTVERAFEGSMHFMTPWFFLNGLVHGELSMMKMKRNDRKWRSN